MTCRRQRIRPWYILGVAGPERLLLVELFKGLGLSLDLLGLLFLLLGFLVLVDFLDGSFLIILDVGLGLIFISDLLVFSLEDQEFNGVVDEFGVLLDDFLELAFLEVFSVLILQVEDDVSTTANISTEITSNGEGTTSSALPDVLFIITVVSDDSHTVGNQVGRVETDTKLTDHVHVSTFLDGLHESLGTRTGNGTKIVDQIRASHTNTSISNGQCLVFFVGNDANVEVLGVAQKGLLGIMVSSTQTFVLDLVNGIRGVGNQLSKENVLVGVESIDDQVHQFVNVSLEGIDLLLSRNFVVCSSLGFSSHFDFEKNRQI